MAGATIGLGLLVAIETVGYALLGLHLPVWVFLSLSMPVGFLFVLLGAAAAPGAKTRTAWILAGSVVGALVAGGPEGGAVEMAVLTGVAALLGLLAVAGLTLLGGTSAIAWSKWRRPVLWLSVASTVGIAVSVVLPGPFTTGGCGGRATKAVADLRSIGEALELYRLDHGAYPADLSFLAPYESLHREPWDPWGYPYRYGVAGNGFDLRSLGADGADGGDGANADIVYPAELRRAD